MRSLPKPACLSPLVFSIKRHFKKTMYDKVTVCDRKQMRTKSNVDLKQKSKKSLYFVLNFITIKLAPYLSNVIRSGRQRNCTHWVRQTKGGGCSLCMIADPERSQQVVVMISLVQRRLSWFVNGCSGARRSEWLGWSSLGS